MSLKAESSTFGSDFFPFGASYAPVAKATEVSCDHWEEDMIRMKGLGFTVFRAFAAWDRIETVEGVRDYGKLDYAFELADKYNLKIMLNVGGLFDNLVGIYPPMWLFTKYTTQHIITDATKPLRPLGTRQLICKDDPVYREKAEAHLVETIKRYGDSETLYCWQVWNEPNQKRPCFCPHTQEKFRGWLKNKYGGELQNLNTAWGSEYPVTYQEWDQVEPHPAMGFLAGGTTPFFDWQNFLRDHMVSYIKWIHDLVKDNDKLNRPTTVNVMRFDVETATNHTRTSPLKVGKTVDVLGYSYYTTMGRCTTPHVISARLDRIRCASRAEGGSFYVIEAEAGRVSFGSFNDATTTEACNGLVYTTEADRTLRNWQAIGHGAKAFLGWIYRTRLTDTQAGNYSMMAFDGSVPSRGRRFGEMAKVLQKYSSEFAKRFVPKAEVAVLASENTALLSKYDEYAFSEEDEDSYWVRSWIGARRLLREARIHCDFLEDEDVLEGAAAKYKVIIAAFHPNMEKGVADKLKEFVAEGGIVISESLFAFKSDYGNLYQTSPGCGLQEVFGFCTRDPLPVTDKEIVLDSGEKIPTFTFQEILQPLNNSKIIATYSHGDSAIIENTFGKGKTIMAGTFLFSQYELNRERAVMKFIKKILADAGILPYCRVSIADGSIDARDIEVCQLSPKGEEAGNSSIWILLNNSGSEATVEVQFPEDGNEVKDLRTGDMYAVSPAYKGCDFSLELPVKGVSVLMPV